MTQIYPNYARSLINFGSGTYTIQVNGQPDLAMWSTDMVNHQIWDVPAQIVDIPIIDSNGDKNVGFGSGAYCDFDVESTETGQDIYGAWYDWDATASCSFNAELQRIPAPG